MATLSAHPTHRNLEAEVGAVAVAQATALATELGLDERAGPAEGLGVSPVDFIRGVAEPLPDSDTRSKILKSLSVPAHYRIDTVRTILGNGQQMLAQDTVPFAIWCAAHHLGDFAAALWRAVSILGDRDTICAIVGGIVIMSAPASTVPKDWLEKVEKWERSPFR